MGLNGGFSDLSQVEETKRGEEGKTAGRCAESDPVKARRLFVVEGMAQCVAGVGA